MNQRSAGLAELYADMRPAWADVWPFYVFVPRAREPSFVFSTEGGPGRRGIAWSIAPPPAPLQFGIAPEVAPAVEVVVLRQVPLAWGRYRAWVYVAEEDSRRFDEAMALFVLFGRLMPLLDRAVRR